MATQSVMSRFHDAPSAVCPEPTMCEHFGDPPPPPPVLPSVVSSAFSPELLAVGVICVPVSRG